MKTYINDDKHICELTITETREIDGDTVIDTRVFKQAAQALNALGKTITEIFIYNACIDFEDSRFEIVPKSRIDKINKQRDNLPVIFKYNHFYSVIDGKKTSLPLSIASHSYNNRMELVLILKYE